MTLVSFPGYRFVESIVVEVVDRSLTLAALSANPLRESYRSVVSERTDTRRD